VVYVSLVVGKSVNSATLVFFLANTKVEQVVLSKSGIYMPAGQNLVKHNVLIKIYVK